MKQPAFTIQLAGYDITLTMQNRNGYTVQYGFQADRDLSYTKACEVLGQDIMHALACEGKFDEVPNETV